MFIFVEDNLIGIFMTINSNFSAPFLKVNK